jgi:excisionase family DNA binding protein
VTAPERSAVATDRAARIALLIDQLLADEPPPQPSDLHPYLTISEAAAELQVSRNTIKRALATGMIESFKVGRLVRIPREAISAWVTAQLRTRHG